MIRHITHSCQKLFLVRGQRLHHRRNNQNKEKTVIKIISMLPTYYRPKLMSWAESMITVCQMISQILQVYTCHTHFTWHTHQFLHVHGAAKNDPSTKISIYSKRRNSFVRNFQRLLDRKCATDGTSFVQYYKPVCGNGATFGFQLELSND